MSSVVIDMNNMCCKDKNVFDDIQVGGLYWIIQCYYYFAYHCYWPRKHGFRNQNRVSMDPKDWDINDRNVLKWPSKELSNGEIFKHSWNIILHTYHRWTINNNNNICGDVGNRHPTTRVLGQFLFLTYIIYFLIVHIF